jgi:hypothetical protein
MGGTLWLSRTRKLRCRSTVLIFVFAVGLSIEFTDDIFGPSGVGRRPLPLQCTIFWWLLETTLHGWLPKPHFGTASNNYWTVNGPRNGLCLSTVAQEMDSFQQQKPTNKEQGLRAPTLPSPELNPVSLLRQLTHPSANFVPDLADNFDRLALGILQRPVKFL